MNEPDPRPTAGRPPATKNPAAAAPPCGPAGDITAVVVTYNPDLPRLTLLCQATLAQVGFVEIIDNGSRPEVLSALADFACHAERPPASGPTGTLPAERAPSPVRSAPGDIPPPRIRLTPLHENRGIGAAQNVGIGLARARSSRHVLLLDHDSIPEPGMVAALRAAIEQQPPGSVPVAAAGPRYADERQTTSPSPFVQLAGFKRVRCPCERPGQLIEVEHLIASGSLIPLAVLDAVGDMDEALFIDYVDIEWCLRAAHAGYRMLGVCDARMQHQLGETPIAFMGKHLPDHSPLRHYYLFRNALLLQRMPHIGWRWKVVDAYQTVIKYGFYALVATPRWPRIRMMNRGLWDGLLGRGGAYRG